MRSAPSQYGTYYGAASVSQNSSTVQPPQPPTGAVGGTKVSRVGSRKSSASNRPHAQVPQARGAETPSAVVTPTPPYSNLTHRVRTSLSGPGAGSSGASSSHSPDQQGLPRSARLDEEPERGRKMSGMKGVLDRPERRSSMVSPTPGGSKPVSKDPYTRRASMDIPSPNGKSPSCAKTNGVSVPCRARVVVPPSIGKPQTDMFFQAVVSFKIPQDDVLILQYD